MNITNTPIEAMVDQFTLVFTPEDYMDSVEKKLREIQRTHPIKGFRPGKAPKSLVTRLWGESALSDSLNELLNNSIEDILRKAEGKYIPEPLPSEDRDENSLKLGETFTFKYDFGIRPVLDFEVDKSDRFTLYKVMPTPEMKKSYKDYLLSQHGEWRNADVAGEEDNIWCDFIQGDKRIEDVLVYAGKIEGDAHGRFVGAVPGDRFDIDVVESFPNATDRAAMLKMSKEEMEGMDPKFEVNVVKVESWASAEENQETFDKIFGPDKVHSSEEFDTAVGNILLSENMQMTQYRLSDDMKNYFLQKADFQISDSFFRRLMKFSNKEISDEDFEKDYPKALEQYKWDTIVSYLMDKYELTVSKDDMKSAARALMQARYQGYGIPDNLMDDLVAHMLEDEKQARQVEDVASDNVIQKALRERVTIEEKEISQEEYSNLINK